MSLPELQLDFKKFIDKTTILYGESGTGKSFLIVDILYHLKPHIDQIIVISPTDLQNHTYDCGIVPKPFIHYAITSDLLTKLWERQTALAQVYTQVNRFSVIKSLFDKTPDRENSINCIRKINEKLEAYKEELDVSEEEDDAKKKKTLTMEQECNRLSSLIYKNQISLHRDRLSKMNLSDDEKFTLKFLDINPRLVLIFDDCTDQIGKFKNHPVMQKLFYQGRWAFITTIVACHTDKALSPELKKNSFINIFTETSCANAYFSRKSNDMDKAALQRAVAAMNAAFVPSSPYQKLVWVREEKKFYRVTATKRDKFKFASMAIWEFCRLSSIGDEHTTSSNPFIGEFRV